MISANRSDYKSDLELGDELRDFGLSISILLPLPSLPSASSRSLCPSSREPDPQWGRAGPKLKAQPQPGTAAQVLLPSARPAWSLLPGARPRPAAPIFGSGLIACQDLPNVSCNVSIFKRVPEAIFKQEGWGPMLMRGACSELTALPPASPARALGACGPHSVGLDSTWVYF